MTEYTLYQLAKLSMAKLIGDPSTKISGVADLESATSHDASFLSNSRYAPLLNTTKAGVVCINEKTTPLDNKNYLVSKKPSETFQKILEFFRKDRPKTGFSGIHESAVIHKDAIIEDNVIIGPYVVIDKAAKIKQGSFIGPYVYVGYGVEIGEECYLHAHCVIREYCCLGNRVILQPGAIIGSCGFGYNQTSDGIHQKINQLGNVTIEDDVEIGANSTIDRARFQTTRVGEGTKIDNLVQIAHNVTIGKHNILAAQTGISGSSKTGQNVMMGGQVGVADHIEIGDFVMLGAQSGHTQSILKAGIYNGTPPLPLSAHNKTQIHLRNIDLYVKKIKSVEKRLQQLEEDEKIYT